MPKTITVTASSMRTAYYSDSGWRSSSDAFQGCWDNGSSRVGVMVFDGLGTTLKGTNIKSITMKPTISSGTNKPDRTITFYSSNHQTIDTSISGLDYPKDQLGSLIGNGTSGTGTDSTYPGNQIFTLDAATNTELFRALAAYLSAGNICFMLFNGETSNKSGYSYSENYLCFTAITLIIEYEEGLVNLWNGSTWDKYQPFVWDGSKWAPCQPYAWDGSQWSLGT